MFSWGRQLSNPFDSDEYKAWADTMRERLIPKMEDSAVTLMIAPKMTEKFDIDFAVQIGASILLEKPIILVVDRKRANQIPPKLAAIADRVIHVNLNGTPADDADAQKQLRRAMTDFAKQ